MYDGLNVINEYDEKGATLAEYQMANGEVLARQMFGNHGRKEQGYEGNIRTRGGLMYYQTDALGNVMDVTDRTGDTVMMPLAAEKNLLEAEKQLYNLLQKTDASNINVTEIYNDLVAKNAEIVNNHITNKFVSAETLSKTSWLLITRKSISLNTLEFTAKNTWWINMVNSGHVWDLKNRKYNDINVWNQKYQYTLASGKIISLNGDDLGNMYYGAMGSILFTDEWSKFGAGGAQLLSDILGGELTKSNISKELKEYMESLVSGGWGDNPGDADVIQRGIDEYNDRFGN